MRLSLSIVLYEDESLPGIILRLAEKTRAASAEKLAARAVLRQPGSAVTSHDFTRLAEIGSFDVARLNAAAYRPSERFGHNRFLGGDVHRELIDLSRRKLCPVCLSDSPYHRMAWDFGLLTACPKHGVRLITRCQRCERSLDWHYPKLAHCRCGLSLTRMSPQDVSADEQQLNQTMLDILGPQRVSTVPAALAAMNGSDIIRMAMCLGMLMTGWTKERRVESLVAAGPDNVANVMADGVAVILDWPRPLHQFLERQAADATNRKGRYGARKTLGAFYTWLSFLEDGDIRRVLLEATKEFVDADAVLGRRTHRCGMLASVGTSPQKSMALSDVTRELKTSRPRLAKLARLGLIPCGEGDGRGMPTVFDRGAVKTFEDISKRAVTLDELSKILGISLARTRLLVDADIIQPIHRAHDDGLGSWAFDRQVVDGFLSAISPKEAPTQDGRLVGFESVVVALRIRGCDFVQVLRMILDGTLPAVQADDSMVGLKRLRFRLTEVRCVGERVDSRKRVTIAKAAKRLGMKTEMVAHLIKRGLLRQDADGLDDGDVERFAAEYVTGTELARRHGTSPRAMAEKLAAVGVIPVVGPNVDGGRQNVYRRAEIGEISRVDGDEILISPGNSTALSK